VVYTGIEIVGTRDDLEYLYEIISKFWNDESYYYIKGYEDKNKLNSSFSYERRQASYGSRLTKNDSPFIGFKVSWHHIVFSFVALRDDDKIYEIEW